MFDFNSMMVQEFMKDEDLNELQKMLENLIKSRMAVDIFNQSINPLESSLNGLMFVMEAVSADKSSIISQTIMDGVLSGVSKDEIQKNVSDRLNLMEKAIQNINDQMCIKLVELVKTEINSAFTLCTHNVQLTKFIMSDIKKGTENICGDSKICG